MPIRSVGADRLTQTDTKIICTDKKTAKQFVQSDDVIQITVLCTREYDYENSEIHYWQLKNAQLSVISIPSKKPTVLSIPKLAAVLASKFQC